MKRKLIGNIGEAHAAYASPTASGAPVARTALRKIIATPDVNF